MAEVFAPDSLVMPSLLLLLAFQFINCHEAICAGMTADIVLLPPFACCFCLQGGWEDDESLEAAARRETVEEAGVRGSIEVSTTRTHISI